VRIDRERLCFPEGEEKGCSNHTEAVGRRERADEMKNRVFSVAAIVGTEAEWSDAIRRSLRRTRGLPFHANGCAYEYARDPAKRAQHEANLKRYEDLTTLLAGNWLGGISVTVDLQSMRDCLPDLRRGQLYIYAESCAKGRGLLTMTHHEQLNQQNLSHMSALGSVRTMMTVAVFCFIFLCVIQGVTAQDKLLPNQTVAKSIEPGKTRTYSVSLNDGDYVSVRSISTASARESELGSCNRICASSLIGRAVSSRKANRLLIPGNPFSSSI